MKKVLIIFIALLGIGTYSCAEQPQKMHVIIVHGTFAHKAPWAQPGGAFFEEVQNSYPDIHIESFNWGGGMGDDRIKAAASLAEHLITIRKNDSGSRIILIGHSHGGNVITLSSQLLANAMGLRSALGEETLISAIQKISKLGAKTVSPITTKATAKKKAEAAKKAKKKYQKRAALAQEEGKKIKAKFYGALSKGEELLEEVLKLASPEDIPQLVRESTKQLKDNLPKTSWYNIWENPIRLPLIEKAYLLATPVHPEAFLPNKEIIEHTFILSSFKDHVQRVGGAFDRFYPEHHYHITNLHCTLKGNNPSHSNMHHPAIGKWLLSVPLFIDPKIRDYHININPDLSSDIRPELRTATREELEVGKHRTPLNFLKNTKEKYKQTKKYGKKKAKQLKQKMRRNVRRSQAVQPLTPLQ
jgi:hypothetical protein